MIVETFVASVAVVTVAGTWLGLRFAERAIARDDPDAPVYSDAERREALATLERCMQYSQRAEIRAMLTCRPGVLPADVRERAERWCGE